MAKIGPQIKQNDWQSPINMIGRDAKKILNAGLKRANVRLFRNSLPKGVDVAFDLRKAGFAERITTIFDVGANHGAFSRYCRESFPDSRILAFEPVASTFAIFKQNTSGLRLAAYQIGFGEEERTVYIDPHEDSRMNSIVGAASGPGAGKIEIKVNRIDQFCAREKIDSIGLLKTDTEGNDIQVLRGAGSLLSASVFSVLCEVGFHPENKQNTSFQAVFDFLRSQGFDLFAFYNQSQYRPHGCLDYLDVLFVNTKMIERDAAKL